MRELVTEEDLARSRCDPDFRQQLLAENLERLLEALNCMRRSGGTAAETARQLREGADLAIKLADRLQEIGRNSGPRAA